MDMPLQQFLYLPSHRCVYQHASETVLQGPPNQALIRQLYTVVHASSVADSTCHT